MLETVRINIPDIEEVLGGTVGELFDFLDNNGGLTEEFLYQHQPTTVDVINVYATNRLPIGKLDRETAEQFRLAILTGPAVVVARKGYAGRLFVVSDDSFIVQEDAYAIKSKPQYARQISLDWFAAHYTLEFQGLRTSDDGIGDFPRTLLRSRRVVFPTRPTQDRIAELYRRRDVLMGGLNHLDDRVNELISAELDRTPADRL